MDWTLAAQVGFWIFIGIWLSAWILERIRNG